MTRVRAGRVLILCAWLLIVFACLSALAGLVPLEWLRPLGRFVRREDDVTPDRYARYVQLCWFFAVAFAATGLILYRSRDAVARFLSRAKHELREQVPWRAAVAELWGWPGLFLLLGLGVRCWYLDGPVAYDEAYSYLNFASRPWYEAISDYNSPNNHLLNSFLMHLCHRIWGQQAWAFRLPVLITGVVLIAVVYGWARARASRSVGCWAMALTAASPALITYSVDARGYSFLALAAVVLDWSLFRVARGPQRAAPWIAAWAAAVLGMWAMPIMLYPLAGICAWYWLAPGYAASEETRAKPSLRLFHLIVFLWLVALGVVLLYAPAYIFRGFLWTTSPVMDPLSGVELLRELPRAWISAAEWWFAGFIAWPVWMILCMAGLVVLWRRREFPAWLLPFAVAAAMMLLQRVAPPPRVFLFLAPWVYLLVGVAVDAILSRLPRSEQSRQLLFVALFVATALYPVWHEVPMTADERLVYESVEPAVMELEQRLAESPGPARLLTPLPVDIPTSYYLRKHGLELPLNGTPQPGEQIWLFSKDDDSPDVTLQNPSIQLSDWAEKLRPWRKVRRFESITVWQSQADPAR